MRVAGRAGAVARRAASCEAGEEGRKEHHAADSCRLLVDRFSVFEEQESSVSKNTFWVPFCRFMAHNFMILEDEITGTARTQFGAEMRIVLVCTGCTIGVRT